MTSGQGERWGSYLLEERIAAGGMAEVFRARRIGAVGFSRLVCIKRMHQHLSEDSEFVGLFLDEGRTGARLRHRNIVAVEDLGQHEGQFFIAMEYIHGVDLAQLEARVSALGEPFPAPAAVFVAMEVLAALGAAHRAVDPDDGHPLRVVHRDVAPHNVLVSFSGEVKLGDFGIARAERRAQVTSGSVVRGRFGYMPLEQLSGNAVDGRSDLYALGVVLYEMLTGQRPFLGSVSDATVESIVAAQVIDRKRPLAELRPGLSEELCLVVDTLLSKEPDERFSSADAALAVLERAKERVGGAQSLVALMGRLFPSHASVGAARPSLPSAPSPTSAPSEAEPRKSGVLALVTDASDPMARRYTTDPSAEPAQDLPRAVARDNPGGVRWPTVLLALSFFVASATAVGIFASGRRPNTAVAPPAIAREDAAAAVNLPADASVAPAIAATVDARATAAVAARVTARSSSAERPARSDRDASAQSTPEDSAQNGARDSGTASAQGSARSGRGVIRVVITPFGRVSIDDGAFSEELTRPRDFPVSAGRHTVRVTGAVEESVTVEVSAGETETLRFHGG